MRENTECYTERYGHSVLSSPHPIIPLAFWFTWNCCHKGYNYISRNPFPLLPAFIFPPWTKVLYYILPHTGERTFRIATAWWYVLSNFFNLTLDLVAFLSYVKMYSNAFSIKWTKLIYILFESPSKLSVVQRLLWHDSASFIFLSYVFRIRLV